MRWTASLLLSATAALSIASPIPEELVFTLEEAAGQLSIEAIQPLAQCGTTKLAITNGKAPYQVQIVVPVPDAAATLYEAQADDQDAIIEWNVEAGAGAHVFIQVIDAEESASAILQLDVQDSDDSSCLVETDILARRDGPVQGGSGEISANNFFGGRPKAWRRGVVEGGSDVSGDNFFRGRAHAWRRDRVDDEPQVSGNGFFGSRPKGWRRDKVEGGSDVSGNGFYGSRPKAWKRDRVEDEGSGVSGNGFFGSRPKAWRRDRVDDGGSEINGNFWGQRPKAW